MGADIHCTRRHRRSCSDEATGGADERTTNREAADGRGRRSRKHISAKPGRRRNVTTELVLRGRRPRRGFRARGRRRTGRPGRRDHWHSSNDRFHSQSDAVSGCRLHVQRQNHGHQSNEVHQGGRYSAVLRRHRLSAQFQGHLGANPVRLVCGQQSAGLFALSRSHPDRKAEGSHHSPAGENSARNARSEERQRSNGSGSVRIHLVLSHDGLAAAPASPGRLRPHG